VNPLRLAGLQDASAKSSYEASAHVF